MIDPIAVLKRRGVNVDSPISAIREVNWEFGWSTVQQWRNGITELVGEDTINVESLDYMKARYTYLYLVQNFTKLYEEVEDVTPQLGKVIKQTRSDAKNRIERITKGDLVWMVGSREISGLVDGYTDTAGTEKKKGRKGRKKQAAEDLYTKYKDSKSRKEIIEMFMKDLDMSKAGATTYFHNCKKG